MLYYKLFLWTATDSKTKNILYIIKLYKNTSPRFALIIILCFLFCYSMQRSVYSVYLLLPFLVCSLVHGIQVFDIPVLMVSILNWQVSTLTESFGQGDVVKSCWFWFHYRSPKEDRGHYWSYQYGKFLSLRYDLNLTNLSWCVCCDSLWSMNTCYVQPLFLKGYYYFLFIEKIIKLIICPFLFTENTTCTFSEKKSETEKKKISTETIQSLWKNGA